MLSFVYICLLLFQSTRCSVISSTFDDKTTVNTSIVNVLKKPSRELPDQSMLNLSLLDQFKEQVHWSQLAYCTISPYFKTGPLDQACIVYDFQKKNTAIEKHFMPIFNGIHSGTGILGVDHDDKVVHLSFRGTITPGDWKSDLNIGQCSYSPVISTISDSFKRKHKLKSIGNKMRPCDGCLVHCGIYRSFEKFIPKVFAMVQPYLNDGYSLEITGHSLGGAYAQLAGMEYRVMGYQPKVVTFGQLRITNPKLSQWSDELFESERFAKLIEKGSLILKGSYIRVVHQSDFITRFPPRIHPLKDFSHSGVTFEVLGYDLPQNMSNVLFLGKGDPERDWSCNSDFTSIKTYTLAIAHTAYFIPIPLPAFDDPMEEIQ